MDKLLSSIGEIEYPASIIAYYSRLAALKTKHGKLRLRAFARNPFRERKKTGCSFQNSPLSISFLDLLPHQCHITSVFNSVATAIILDVVVVYAHILWHPVEGTIP